METYTKVVVLVALLTVVAVTARPSGDDTKKDEVPRFSRTTSYHGANTRIDPPSDVGLEYYGGARGLVLAYHPVLGLTPAKRDKKEEEEDVGQETEPPQVKPPSGGTDTVVVSKPPPGASVAEARPVGVSIAGVGGTAASQPTATAVVGPAGLAISRPIATAIAGVQIGDQALAGITGVKPQPSYDADGYTGSMSAHQTYKTASKESPVVVAVAPGALESLYYHVIPSDNSEAGVNINNLRGVQYGVERPKPRPNPVVQESPYQKPLGERNPMYGYEPPNRGTFYSTGVQYAYPNPPFNLPVGKTSYATAEEVEKNTGTVLNLAVGPNSQDGKYSVVPLSKFVGQEGNKQQATTYQFVTGGKPPVGFNKLVYPLAFYQ